MRQMLLILFVFCFVTQDVLAFGVYIIRHGESDHNITNTYNSSVLSPPGGVSHLTENGKLQVEETGKKLLGAGVECDNVEKVFVSPLPRTLETADVLVKMGLFPKEAIVVDPRLIEIQYGDLEGKQILPDWQNSYAEKYHTESNEEIENRIKDFYLSLKAHKLSGNVIVITHGVPAQKLMILFSHLNGKLSTGGFVGPL